MLLHSPLHRPQSQRGFTLIEVMITVAILAILAAVAMPSYFESVRKSRRSDAITALSTIAQRQENWRSNNASYTNDLTTSGLNVPNPSSGYYTLTVAFPAGVASSAGYTATATPAGAQVSDTRCGSFSLAASAGQYTYTATGPQGSSRCWSR
jgi:type IV pilus assembly protein PilE